MLNLKNNEAKRTELGNNGKIWAQNFDSKNIWEAMKELYESQN
jgi:hypothetical protein